MKIADIAELEWNKGLEFESISDYENAIVHYTKASELGHTVAQVNLANIYDDINGFQNIDLALYWYHKSVDSKDQSAAWNLSVHYKSRNFINMAIYWADKASVLGHPDGRNEATALRGIINNTAN